MLSEEKEERAAWVETLKFPNEPNLHLCPAVEGEPMGVEKWRGLKLKSWVFEERYSTSEAVGISVIAAIVKSESGGREAMDEREREREREK